MSHKTVLTTEAVDALKLKPNSVVVDCTIGAGGHAKEILRILSDTGTYIGIDADSVAVKEAEHLKDQGKNIHLVCGNFRNLKSILSGLDKKPDAILADLGWRTEQFEDLKKGFSFNSDDPLLMTYGESADYTFTANDIVNDWEEESIADIIYGYGEERYARKIAKAIVIAREDKEIKTAKELSEIVKSALPKKLQSARIHPATKTFQALRIAVNDELGALKDLLECGPEVLNPGGRMAIITFHSLEDRLVKQAFRRFEDQGKGTRVNKKPITANQEELTSNPRARSAKLRIVEKNHDTH